MVVFGGKTTKKSSRRPRHTAVTNTVSNSRPKLAFSYYANRPAKPQLGARRPLPQDTVTSKVWALRLHQLPSFVALIVVLLSVVYTLSLSSNPRVLMVGVTPSSLLRPLPVYQQAAEQQFKSSVLSQTKLTVDTLHIASQLKQAFPELEDVTIALPLMGRRPLVYIVPTTPALDLTGRNGSFILNQQGRAIMTTDKAPQRITQQLPTVIDQSGLAIEPGQGVLPAGYVGFISTVIGQFKAKQLGIASLTLPAASSELDVRLSGQVYTIKMNLQDDARQQTGDFLVTKQKLEQDNQVPSSYFDVRIPGRVYYK